MSDKNIKELESKAEYYLNKKKNGQFDQVIAELTPLLPQIQDKSELRKILSNTHLDRGAANYQCGNDDKALADFEEATRIDRENWKAFVNAASLYMADQRWREALNAMEKAFTINKDLNYNQSIVDRFKTIRSHV